MNRRGPVFWALLFAALALGGATYIFFGHPLQDRVMMVYSALLFFLGMVFASLLATAFFISRIHAQQLLAQRKEFYYLSYFSNTFFFEYRLRSHILTFSDNLPKELKLDTQMEGLHCNHRLHTLVHPEDMHKIRSLVDDPPSPGREVALELRLLHNEGGYVWYECRAVATHDRFGKPSTLLGRFENIDIRKRREANLVSRSTLDDLTGLLNRSAVTLRVDEWTQSTQSKEGGALFMLDLDNFKLINDTMGHASGDRALLLTARTLRETFRDSDILGRAGGDEFLVFMSGVNTPELAASRAEALCLALTQKLEESDCGFSLTCSVGISLYPQDGDSYSTLFEAADAAMYQAKREGKNAYRLCSNNGNNT